MFHSESGALIVLNNSKNEKNLFVYLDSLYIYRLISITLII